MKQAGGTAGTGDEVAEGAAMWGDRPWFFLPLPLLLLFLAAQIVALFLSGLVTALEVVGLRKAYSSSK